MCTRHRNDCPAASSGCMRVPRAMPRGRPAGVAKPRAEPAEPLPAVEAADGKAVGHATVPFGGSRSATEPGCTRTRGHPLPGHRGGAGDRS
ncbi:hypothetical protein OHT68_24135 [Streptomyces canus]|uniref:hypothetical protein n=1 Tax=Streptomyces canus TaxID=58343 RepID=UPI002E2E7938|nr:hypothetical protein [Streptomyces canus]